MPIFRDFKEHCDGSSVRLAQIVQAAVGTGGQAAAFDQALNCAVEFVIGAVTVLHDKVLDLVREISELDAATTAKVAATSARLVAIRISRHDKTAHQGATLW